MVITIVVISVTLTGLRVYPDDKGKTFPTCRTPLAPTLPLCTLGCGSVVSTSVNLDGDPCAGLTYRERD